MDLKKTGTLISQRRKELSLTQKDLADRLQVTDKAISRWETGKGFPESSLLQPLAQALELSIAEIVNGVRTEPERAAEQTDNALVAAVSYAKRMQNTVVAVLMAVAGTYFLLAPLFTVGIHTGVSWCVAALLYTGAMLQFWNKWPSAKVARLLGATCMVAALVLQIIPGSAVLVFSGPDYHKVELLSCFDLMLVGYAMFTPFLSGVINGASVLMMFLLLVFKKENLTNKIFVCTILAGIFMVLPALLSWEYVTVMGLLAALLLFFSVIFQSRANA